MTTIWFVINTVLRAVTEAVRKWFRQPKLTTTFAVDRAVRAALAGVFPRMSVYRLDGTYRVPARADVAQMLRWNLAAYTVYVKEHNDCDDIALGFKVDMRRDFDVGAVAVVVDESKQHVYNAVVCWDPAMPEQGLSVVLVDPVSGVIDHAGPPVQATGLVLV